MLDDASEAHRLTGFSGADVFRATRDGRHWFVRKAASSPVGNERLRRQVAKQTAFAAAAGLSLRTPRILGEGTIDERYYFDMEYVRGLDGVSYLRQASYPDVVRFGDRLCEYLLLAAEQPPLMPSASASLFESLYNKICDVQRTTQRIAPHDLSRLFLALDRLRNLPQMNPTLCHGDLTLQNMLIDDDGTIWVVDLLDAPFEHYWQDVAKLQQDLSGGWYLLQQAPIAQCVLDYLRQRLIATAVRLMPSYAEVHSLLVACTFVRILPYAHTPEQIEFVTRRIGYFAGNAV